jgi:hypothetical protein
VSVRRALSAAAAAVAAAAAILRSANAPRRSTRHTPAKAPPIPPGPAAAEEVGRRQRGIQAWRSVVCRNSSTGG